MAFSAEKSFVYKWLGKLKSDLRRRLRPDGAVPNRKEERPGRENAPFRSGSPWC